MSYYDRWDDRNRDAREQGEHDARYGYRHHQYDYDSFSEPRAAYDDGYNQERMRQERIREEREQEEREYERIARRDFERRIYEQEAEYYAQLEQQRYDEQMEPEHEESAGHLLGTSNDETSNEIK